MIQTRFALAFALLLTATDLAWAQSAAPAALTLRPGDLVQIKLLREPERSGEFLVDDRGIVTLPIIGSRVVVSAPWLEVRDSLVAAYLRELADSSVAILALHRVSVLGSVTRPGVYHADPSLTIAQAVALAGGASEVGDLRRIRVVRNGETLIARAAVDSPLAQAGIRSGDQLFVDRRGWFDRNSPTAVSALVGILGVVVTLILFR